MSHACDLYEQIKGKGRGKLFFTHTDRAVVNLCIQEEGLGINNPFARVYIPSDENPTKCHSLTTDQIKLLQQRCKQQDDSLRWLAALNK